MVSVHLDVPPAIFSVELLEDRKIAIDLNGEWTCDPLTSLPTNQRDFNTICHSPNYSFIH